MSNIAVVEPRPQIIAGHRVEAIVPTTMDEAYRLSVAIHKSGLAPYEIDTPEKIMIALMCGLELGLKPMQAIQRIAVINGRPTIYGDAAIGLVRSSGLCEWIRETVEGEGDARKAVCVAKRKGDPETIRGEFSVADAKIAKLWGKTGPKGPTPWVTHPDRMLKMRARGFALRDGFADILSGMYLHEELEGEAIDAVPAIPTPPTPPQLAPSVDVSGSVASSLPRAEGKTDAAHIAELPNRSERGEFADKNGVEIPLGALNDFEAFHRALGTCPTLEALNDMFAVLTKNMAHPDDLEEAQSILREIASRFPFEDGEP